MSIATGGKQESMLDTDITCPHGIEGAPSSNDLSCRCITAILILPELLCENRLSITDQVWRCKCSLTRIKIIREDAEEEHKHQQNNLDRLKRALAFFGTPDVNAKASRALRCVEASFTSSSQPLLYYARKKN